MGKKENAKKKRTKKQSVDVKKKQKHKTNFSKTKKTEMVEKEKSKKKKQKGESSVMGLVEVLALHGTDELVDIVAGRIADVDRDTTQTAWGWLDPLLAFDNSHRDRTCLLLLQRLPSKRFTNKAVQVLCKRSNVKHVHFPHVFVQIHVKKVCVFVVLSIDEKKGTENENVRKHKQSPRDLRGWATLSAKN